MAETLTNTSQAIGYRVLHSRRSGEPTGYGAYAPWRDDMLFLPVEVRDAIAPDPPVARLELNVAGLRDDVWNWRKYFAVDDMISIVSDHPKPEDRVALFTGFIADVDWTFDRDESCHVTAVGTPFRLARDAAYVVYGRMMQPRNWTLQPFRSYTGLPCAFNAGGRPNRESAPLYPDIPIFTHDGDPDAAWWTVVEAINYLQLWYNSDETWLKRHTFTLAEKQASKAFEADVDGMGLWEALAVVGSHDGWDVCCDFAHVRSGGSWRATSTTRCTKRGTGRLITLDHQPPNADGSLQTLDTARTNLFGGSVAETVSSCVTRPIIAGGRALYEITVELGRAWDSSKLEIPAGGRIVMTDEHLYPTDPYVKRYVRGGGEFPWYRDVGRRWDANTDGLYRRLYGLITPDMAALAGETAGTWPAMPYKALNALTRAQDASGGPSVGVVIEYSLDSTAWQPLGGGFQVQPGRLGIWLSCRNLAAFPLGGVNVNAAYNLFQRLVYGHAFRLRMTCTIAGPDRRVSCPARRPGAGTVFEQSAWFDRATAGQFRSRSASSRFAGTSLTADEQTAAAADAELNGFAETAQDNNEDRFIEATLPIEWIATDVTLASNIERISGIDVDLQTNAGAAKRTPRVIARTFLLTPGEYSTQLTLDTERKQAVL